LEGLEVVFEINNSRIEFRHMNEKLKKIFVAKFNEIAAGTRTRVGHRNLRNKWKNYLSELEGVDRMGKLMSMVIDCPSDKIQIVDPFGEDAILRINKEMAIKIVTLGYIP